MSKLLSVLVAAMFAVGSTSALAAAHAGAQMKDGKKTEKATKKKAEGKKSEGKKSEGKKSGAKKMDAKK